MVENNNTLTPFQQQCASVVRTVKEYKLAAEANIVAILYKKPSLLREIDLTRDDFSNNIWKVYFVILYDVIIKENKKTVDEIIVGMYLNKHSKLRAVYEKNGGYQTIIKAGEYVKIEALDGYIQELKKWEAVVKLASNNWIDLSKLPKYVDMSIEEIYNNYEARLNDIFINADQRIHAYDITDGIDELVEKLDAGQAVGLPYHNLPMLTKETGGQYLGAITLIGALSNTGKSSFCRNATIYSLIKNDERCVIMLNEEGLAKWQRELIVWVANNVLKEDLQKYVVRDGNYDEHTKQVIKDAVAWIKEKTKNHILTVIPFDQYKTSKVIKILRKYSSMGVKYFALDTFKYDAGRVGENAWLEMQQHMVEINDIVKPEANNLHILVTFQLNKGSSRQKYYTQDNVGLAKNIIDPVSTCLMFRNLYDDERPGARHEVKVYELAGKYGKSKIEVKLDPNKHYQIVFIVKNREGSAAAFQIVVEHDLSRNVLKEVGICNVPMD